MTADIRRRLLEQLWCRLRCPSCHAPLSGEMTAGTLICATCRQGYPVLAGGAPVLLSPARQAEFRTVLEDTGGKRMLKEYHGFGTWRARLRSWIRPPSIVYDEAIARKYAWIYDTRGEHTIALSIGGGPGRENPRVLNLNIDAFDSVDIVGDGCNIPLCDDTCDTVTCNAVIEHVPEPAALVAEIHRILKPGGYAQLMIPFVFPFHAYPADYQRYTEQGILGLTTRFDRVELSVLTGPTSAMLVLLREYLRLIVPGGNHGSMRTVLNGLSGWLTFPLKYIDVLLNQKPEAAGLAAAFYYLGRKR